MELAAELEIDFEAFGMATWRRPDLERRLEADQCYYIANVAIVWRGKEPNLEVDPPPDLAVEVDITSGSIDRMTIYAHLRVPEVWRYDGRRLSMFHLQPTGRYELAATSLSFAELRPADVERFIEQAPATPKPQWARAIRDWVQAELIPRRTEA
jgi:Uma2 family endonuclease